MTTQMTREPRRALAASDDAGMRAGIAAFSLALLALGLVGFATDTTALSATGLFLYAFVGFGAAALLTLGYKGWDLVAFSPPLGLAVTLLVGVFLTNTGTWSIGPALFWVLVVASAVVHVIALGRTFLGSRSRRIAETTGRPGTPDSRDSTRPGSHRFTRRPRPLVLAAGTLTVIGLVLCLGSAFAARHLDPGLGGLLGAVSPAWYVGLALLAVALVLGQRIDGPFTGLPVVALQAALTLTPAIVFDYPRFAWTAKQVGLTSYILLHGSVNSHIDIYQAWPGVFSGVAWVCRASHLADPTGVARWWVPVVDLATLLVVRQLAVRVLQDSRRAWLAAALFVLGYSIADANYFSPQSAAYLLAIATFAVFFRHDDENSGLPAAEWVLAIAMSLAAAATHQLTPYMVTLALIVLALLGRAKTRWAPAIPLVPAVAWAGLRSSYVKKNLSLHQLAHPFHNLLTPGAAAGGPTPDNVVKLSEYAQAGGLLVIGLIALAALVRYRNRLHLTLGVCAASGIALVFANSYGNEATYRVAIFALPWLAVLAADLHPRMQLRPTIFWAVSVPVLLAAFLAADMGLDYVYAERPGDLTAMKTFERTAPAGSTLVILGYPGNFPGNATGRYNLVNEQPYTNIAGFSASSTRSASINYQQFMTDLLTTNDLIPASQASTARADGRIYLLVAKQPAAYLVAYNYATKDQFKAFAAQIADSSKWNVVRHTPTAELYRLAPAKPDS